MKHKIPVAVLAATGSVGQRFVQLLDGHPWFEVVALTGSDRGLGKPYAEVCRWLLAEDMPAWARDLPVLPTTPEAVQVPLAFSGLPADVARDAEPLFAQAGTGVCSNASAYRREADVPILLPEINACHAEIIPIQRKKRGWSGFIATNPNCTSTGMTVALKPLLDAFGLRRVFAVSLQALSGAGYPGVASTGHRRQRHPLRGRRGRQGGVRAAQDARQPGRGRVPHGPVWHLGPHQPRRGQRRARGVPVDRVRAPRRARRGAGSLAGLPGRQNPPATCPPPRARPSWCARRRTAPSPAWTA